MGWSTSLLRPAVRGQAYTNFQMGEIVVQKPDNPEDLDPGLGDPPFTELRGGEMGRGGGGGGGRGAAGPCEIFI